MPLKLTGSGQPVTPDRPQRYTDSNRPIGSTSILNGRRVVWAGPGWRWQSQASFNRLQSTGRLNRSIFSDPLGVIGNELRYIGRQVQETNRRGGGSRPQRATPRGAAGVLSSGVAGAAAGARAAVSALGYMANPPSLVTSPPGGQTGRNVVAALGFGVAENAARLGVAIAQRQQGQRGNPENNAGGNAIERIVNRAYELYGATPPGKQNSFERNLDATVRSIGTGFVGTATATAAIPSIGTGAAGAAITGGARWALGEVLSTFFDDNRGGNLSNLGEMAGVNLPLAVDVGKDDWIDSAIKSLVPNAVPGVAISGLGGIVSGLRNTRRWLGERRIVDERTGARQELQQAGIIDTDPATGAASFREAEDQAQQQIDSWINAGGDTPAPAGAAPTGSVELPAAPPARAADDAQGDMAAPGGALEVDGVGIDPSELIYDPTLPEADVVLNLVRNLDDEELLQLVSGTGPVVPQLDELLAAKELMPARPELEQGNVFAPAGSVAERIGPDGQPLDYLQTLEAMPMETLRSVAAPENNPDLARLITGFTGREWQEFSKADIIEGLGRLQEEDGQALLVRDWRQGVRRVEEIDVDPARFQFKQDTNEAGEQMGNSLAGVNRWDTVAEGTIDVWTDPADGRTYVVNGHNRLARARQLGIPTLPVRELPAATAAEARAQGALANIKEGRGTVFDAAKFMRESGITDVAQLERMGAPMSDGHSARGLALSKLPDNIFQAAIDGRLSVGKAAALGGSGLDETQMQRAFQVLSGRDMSDAKFGEIVQQVKSAPVVQGTQVDLFGNTEALSLMDQKADLVTAIRRDLLSERRVFGTAARGAGRLEQAGNVIDAQGNRAIAADRELVLRTFDQLKYAPGPVGDLLNDGARQIAEGAKAKVVADRIREQVAEAVRRSLDEQGLPAQRPAADGAEAAASEDADALFAEAEALLAGMGENTSRILEGSRRMLEVSAGIEDIDGAMPTDRIVPGPRALSPEERSALRLDVIRKAVSGAEVRPPETPLPEPPAGPAVPLEDAIADLDGQRGAPQPGTPAAQAVADELRLAAEFHQRDAEARAIAEEGLRDATGYELKTFEEKKRLGMADGYDLVKPGEELTHGTSRSAAASIMQEGFRPSRVRAGGTLMGEGVYMADNPRYAGGYGPAAVGGPVPEGARILDLVSQGKTVSDFAEEIGVGRPADLFEGERYFSDAQQMAVRQWALDNGYDGIKFDPAFDEVGQSASEVVIYNLGLANRMVGANAALAPAPARPEPMQLVDEAPVQIDIPTNASTKLSPGNVQGTAEILYNWANVGFPEGAGPIRRIEQARALVEAKGRMLWPERIPGVDLGKAQNARAMGRTSPDVQAVAAAYRQFYGVPGAEPQRPVPRTKKADLEARRQIEANNLRMDALRRQAEQEGC